VKDEQNKGKVKSLIRAIRILESFGKKEKMGITEISRKLGLPKSSTYDIVNTLLLEGILEREDESNKYYLGLRLFELGNRARANLEIRRVATPFLRNLNNLFDETTHLTVLDNDEVLYIECFESTKRLRTYSVIGVRAPLHCTAVGKAIMAFLPENEIMRIIRDKGLEKFTENTITDKEELLLELKRVRECGYSVDNMEHEVGVKCVGAAIHNHTGKVFASISVSGPSQRLKIEEIPEIADSVVSAAREISRKLGFVN